MPVAELASALASQGASVKDIFHERAWLHSSVDRVVIKAILETRGTEHNQAILRHLHACGYENAGVNDGELGSPHRLQ